MIRISFPKSPAKTGLFLFLTLFFLSGCFFRSNNLAQKPVVQVNKDYVLVAKDFADQLARRLKTFDALAAKDPNNIQRAKDDILRDFILKSLIKDFAAKNKLKISSSDVDVEINKIRSSYPDDLTFRRFLAAQNLSFVEWRDEIESMLLQRKVFKLIGEIIPSPTATEMESYYNQNKDLFKRKERILLRQIVIDDEARANLLKDELKKKDFAELAKKFSVAPEAKKGGLVGWVEKGSVDTFDKAFLLPVGGVSQVLESPYGYHIFKVEKKEAASHASYDEVKEFLRQSVLAKKEQAEFANWLDKQIRSSNVLKNVELIKAMDVETRGGLK